MMVYALRSFHDAMRQLEPVPRCTALATLIVVLAIAGCGDGKKTSNKKPGVTKEPATPLVPPPDAFTPPVPKRITLAPATPVPRPPRGLPETPSPQHNPTTPAKVALGKLLFFDVRLSHGDKISCGSCHVPEKGWSDGRERSRASSGKLNLRHTPTLINVGYAKEFYWDGRIRGLESLIVSNWKGQMGADPAAVAKRLATMPIYRAHFQRTFSAAPTEKRIADALAAFVRTIRSGNSPWDRYELGDKNAVSDDVVAGYKLFREKAQCATCHPPPLYTDLLFHNTGVGFAGGPRDPGRYLATNKDADNGSFKTPTLRGAAASAPYFHDGSAANLAHVLDYKLAGGFRSNNPHIDRTLEAHALTTEEKRKVLVFLAALSPETVAYSRPNVPGLGVPAAPPVPKLPTDIKQLPGKRPSATATGAPASSQGSDAGTAGTGAGDDAALAPPTVD